MYALYSPEPIILERVRDAIPSTEDGVATTSWSEFAMLALRSDSLLIASRWLSHDLRVPLRAIALESYPAPLILITSKDADNARSALNTGPTNIIWLSEVHRDLHTLVCGTRARQVLNRRRPIANGLEASEIPRAPRQVAPLSSISMRQSSSKVGIVGSTVERTRPCLTRARP
jgi:hypothetical protein